MPSLRSPSSQSGLSPMDATLQWILTLFPSLASSVPPEQAISLSRQLSLLMVGIILLGSIRAVFKGVNKVANCQSNVGLSANILTSDAACDKQEPCCLPHASSPGSDIGIHFTSLEVFGIHAPLIAGDVSIVNANSTPHIVSTITGCYKQVIICHSPRFQCLWPTL